MHHALTDTLNWPWHNIIDQLTVVIWNIQSASAINSHAVTDSRNMKYPVYESNDVDE